MQKKDTDQLHEHAKEMRRNMTPEEKRLWYGCLKKMPVVWKRQEVFYPYIVDFYCPSAKLAVEADGSQHYSKEALAYDAERTKHLESTYGLQVLRFPNRYLTDNLSGAYDLILETVQKRQKAFTSPGNPAEQLFYKPSPFKETPTCRE